MKFLPVALAGLTAAAVSAKKTKSSRKLTRSMVNQVNAALRKDGRKLDGDEWQVSPDQNVRFNTCLNLKVENENVYEDPYTDLVQGGYAESIQSYVVFTVCDADDCYYQSQDLSFVTDVATWVEGTAGYSFNKKQDFCEQCRRFEDYCAANDDGGNADADADGDDGGRKLGDNYIDCDECNNNLCFEEEGDDDGIQEEDVVQYVQQMSECQQLGVEFDDDGKEGIELSAKLVCSSDGTGLIIGMFLDGDCTIRTTQYSYEDYVGLGDDDNVNAAYELHQDVLDLPQNSYIECAAEVEYDDPDADDDGNADDDKEDEASEYCRQLFDDNTVSLNADYGCGIEDDDDNQEEEEENDDANNWYEYDLAEEDAEDIQAVCDTIQKLDYEYFREIVDFDDDVTSSKQKREGGGNGVMIFVIVAVIVAIGGYAAYTMLQGQKKTDKSEPLYKGGAMS